VLWATGITGVGYYVGQIPAVHNNLEAAIILIVAASVLPMVVEFFLARRRARQQSSEEVAVASGAHVDRQLAALAELTFQQWFTGRAAYVREFAPTAADFGEQAMRADYIAEKAWWLRTYDAARHPDYAAAVAAASAELPRPSGNLRSMRRGWLEQVDAAITSAARNIP